MKTILKAASLAALAVAIAPASAQTKAPTTQMIIVDNSRILSECTACKGAQAALKGQIDALQARQQALVTPLQTEGQAIQTAVNALAGKEPDAALKARVTAFQAKQQAAQRELQGREETINRNRAYVGQQIGAKLNPIVVSVMKARGANIAVDPNPQIVLAYEPALDVTADVLAQLNTQLPSVSAVAPAAPAAAPASPPAPPGR